MGHYVSIRCLLCFVAFVSALWNGAGLRRFRGWRREHENATDRGTKSLEMGHENVSHIDVSYISWILVEELWI
jgi:hypothetical protein